MSILLLIIIIQIHFLKTILQEMPYKLYYIHYKLTVQLVDKKCRGTFRLACSDETFQILMMPPLTSKHPAEHPETTLPSPPDHDDLERILSVNEFDIRQAIHSFPRGSAGALAAFAHNIC